MNKNLGRFRCIKVPEKAPAYWTLPELNGVHEVFDDDDTLTGREALYFKNNETAFVWFKDEIDLYWEPEHAKFDNKLDELLK